MNFNRWGALVAIVVVLGVVFFLVTYDWHPLPAQLTVCRDLIPRDYATTIGFDWNGKDVALKLGKDSTSRMPDTDQAARIIDAVTKCVQSTGGKLDVQGGVYLGAEEPLGEVIDHWKDPPGDLQVSLKPRDAADEKILNNLAIGPAAGGSRAEIMASWCSKLQACVKCETTAANGNPVAVAVQSVPNAPTETGIMAGTWPVPPPGRPAKPWQLVDKNGKRTIYRCKG